jgi:hypothetical protein
MRILIGLLVAGIISPAQVTFDRILHAEREPGNWLTYSGNYSSHRFSPLDQMNPQNVKNLRPTWVYQFDALDKAETTPLDRVAEQCDCARYPNWKDTVSIPPSGSERCADLLWPGQPWRSHSR